MVVKRHVGMKCFQGRSYAVRDAMDAFSETMVRENPSFQIVDRQVSCFNDISFMMVIYSVSYIPCDIETC